MGRGYAREHRLKVWPGPYEALKAGTKVHEFRRNDREYELGDTLILREWCPDRQDFTGRKALKFKVTYVGRGFGVPDGYVVMSIARVVEQRRRR
jgi:hypothetical protein